MVVLGMGGEGSGGRDDKGHKEVFLHVHYLA